MKDGWKGKARWFLIWILCSLYVSSPLLNGHVAWILHYYGTSGRRTPRACLCAWSKWVGLLGDYRLPYWEVRQPSPLPKVDKQCFFYFLPPCHDLHWSTTRRHLSPRPEEGTETRNFASLPPYLVSAREAVAGATILNSCFLPGHRVIYIFIWRRKFYLKKKIIIKNLWS